MEENEGGGGGYSQYGYEEGEDEEMVIVVVDKDGDNNMMYEDDEELNERRINEEIAYNFIKETVGDLGDEPFAQQEQAIGTTELAFPLGIVGTKTLTVKQELCRLCLSKHCNMVSLFDTCLTFFQISLKEVIQSCIGIKVLRDDATDKICRACITRLESIWAFREECERSNRLVKQMKKTKIIHNKNATEGFSDGTHLSSNNESLVKAPPQPFSCTICDRGFATEVALSGHVTNDHAHLKPFTQNTSFLISCSICGRKVLKKVLHDHYLTHKLLGEGKSIKGKDEVHRHFEPVKTPAAQPEAEELEEDVDDVEGYEGDYQEGDDLADGLGDGQIGEREMDGQEIVPSLSDLADTETGVPLDAEQIRGFLSKENEATYTQNECFVTDISGSEFINVNPVEGQANMNIIADGNNMNIIAAENNINIIAAENNMNIITDGNCLQDPNNPNVIAMTINEGVQGGNFVETVQGGNFVEGVQGGTFVEGAAPQYTQVYLVNQNDNLVEAGNMEATAMQDVVTTATLEDNQIYVVTSDGKAMYGDQDVVFQIANDQVYQTDSGIKDDIEVQYENINATGRVTVKEEVIDTSYDQC
ncbi:uncharacterized protein LOC111050713 isoform X2 [Nilaparvata lugens]|nr:uncharacterized protein LOC111050713 isoform X2 [Nilaparvata lugens]